MPVTWLKKGSAAAQEVEKFEKEVAQKKAARNKMRRFFLKDGETTRITFIDGALSKEGVLDIVTCREHGLFLKGSYDNNYICTVEQEPCPLCEQGDNASLVGVLTIIDHTEYTGKDGKKYKDQVRLFVAKSATIKLLQKMAITRGGLNGCTFEVSRLGDKSAKVGSHFDFIEKKAVDELKKVYTQKVKDEKTSKEVVVTKFTAANYEKELTYLSAAELRQMGFGNPTVGVGAEKPLHDPHANAEEGEASGSEDLSTEL